MTGPAEAAFTHTPEIERRLDLALNHHMAGDWSAAEKLYHEVLAASPKHPEALHYLGLLAHQTGHPDVALDLIPKAIAVMPDYVEAHGNLANILVQLERAEDAEDCCRKTIALDAENVGAHINLGKALRMQGKLEEAAAHCRTALKLDANRADAWEALGGILCDLERPQEAVECFQKAIALNPGAARCHNNLGSALHTLDRLDEAVASFRKALQIEPDSALFNNNLGGAYYTLRQLDGALACFDKAARLAPDFVMAQQNLANVLRDMGRVDDAIAAFEKVLALKPEHVSARHNLNALLGRTTDTAPREYVEDLFDQFANRFEEHLQDKLEYDTPALMRQRLDDLGLATAGYETVVDLGCGTGLVGAQFKGIAKTLIGIDVSKKMIRQAQNKGVYDQLLVDDLSDGLARVAAPVDLFLCADVFIYVGNLRATFAAVDKAAAPSALFVCSTEHLNEADAPSGGFVLQDTSRYAHTQAYIEDLSSSFGFQVAHFETTRLRKEKSGWITGGLYVLKRA